MTRMWWPCEEAAQFRGQWSSNEGPSSTAEYKQSLRALTDDVDSVIEAYRYSTERPPFDAIDITSIALCHLDNGSGTISDIISWILHYFTYYSHLVVDTTLETRLLEQDERRTVKVLNSFLKEINMLLTRYYDLPVTSSSQTNRFQIIPSAARVFLRRWLEPERDGVFRLMGFPKELRVQILEYVVACPYKTLRQNAYGRWCAAIEQKKSTGSKRNPKYRSAVDLYPVHRLLNVLMTCRIIYKETLPLFYERHIFYLHYWGFRFPDTIGNGGKADQGSDFSYRLPALPPTRFSLLQRVVVFVDFSTGHDKYDKKGRIRPVVVPGLSEARDLDLKVLTLTASDDWLLSRTCWNGLNPKLDRNEGGPLDTLRGLGLEGLVDIACMVEKVEIEGDCPYFREFLGLELSKRGKSLPI